MIGKGSITTQEGAAKEQEEIAREQRDGTGISARAGRRRLSQQEVTCWPKLRETIYILYTPRFTFPGREREQGRFKESTGGAKGRSKGAWGEH